MKVWVVNDYRSTIPGSKTLWDDLIEWFDADFIGGDYGILQAAVNSAFKYAKKKPDVIIRNGSYFPPLHIPAVPQIALFQDILLGRWKVMQQQVMRGTTPVFNSEWTKAQFPEELTKDGWVIPLSVNFDLFKPLPDREGLRKKWSILPNSICWIGAYSEVKGWDILEKLIKETEHNWAIVVKDEISPDLQKYLLPNVRVFSRLPQSDLVEVINACSVGLCTSRVETQHLAGLEMGACGLPLVTTNVGAYYNRKGGIWSWYNNGWPAKRMTTNNLDIFKMEQIPDIHDEWRANVRSYWLKEGFDRESCAQAWEECVTWVTG